MGSCFSTVLHRHPGYKMVLFLEVKWRCPSSASIHQCTVRHDSPGQEELIQGCHDGDSDIHFEPMSNMDLFGYMIYYSIILTQQKLCPQVDWSSCHVDFHCFTVSLRPPTEEMLSKLIYVKWCVRHPQPMRSSEMAVFFGQMVLQFENQGWRCVICILKKVEIIEGIMYHH